MKKIKLYLDTSVIGNLDEQSSPQDMAEAHALWDLIKQGEFDVVISEVTLNEITANKNLDKVRTLLAYINEITYESVSLDDEINHIADLVKQAGMIAADKHINDRRHIGCALVARADILVSTNYDDLVNMGTILGVRKIAMVEGYGFIEIFTPRMVLKKGGK